MADDVELSVGDLIRTVEIREAIRALLAAHNNLPADVRTATTQLNAAAERAEFVPQLDLSGGSRLEPRATGLDRALGQILAAIHAATANGTWERIKACERDSCRWAFYDHSKNRSGRWCQGAPVAPASAAAAPTNAAGQRPRPAELAAIDPAWATLVTAV